MRYLDPKNDLTFKKVFGEHPDLLKSFLNALLPLKEDEQIESLEYLPADMVPQIPLQKYTIVDVRCTDQKGRQFVVEMQMHWTTAFMQRVLFNASKAYVRQLNETEEFKLLQPVYALSLVNENFEKEIPEFYHHYKIVHTLYNKKQIKGLEFVFVELGKFKPENISEKKLMVLWLRFLTEIKDGTEEIDEKLLENKEIRQAVEHVKESAFTREELETYDKYWDSIRSVKTLVSGAKEEGEEIGVEKGKVEGEKIGIKKGEKIGIEKGEKIKGYRVALESLKNGLEKELISKITQVPSETIEKLSKLFEKYGNQTEEHFDEI